jgi:ribosomal protein S18 acetylase RimI-like enzyme
MQDIIQLETQLARVWPAFNSLVHDGWLLRLSRGFSLHTNAVLPLQRGRLSNMAKIRYCQEQYQLQRLPCCFRLTSLLYHEELARDLRQLGYQTVAGGRLLRMPLASSGTQLKTLPLNRWLDLTYRLNPADENGQRLLEEQLLGQVDLPMWCAVIEAEGIAVGYGRVVLSGANVYLEDLWVAPDWRRQGHGTRLLDGLQAFAQQRGGTTTYLSHNTNNQLGAQAAAAFLRHAGFSLAYEYGYMEQP